jgi:hypothetical protein
MTDPQLQPLPVSQTDLERWDELAVECFPNLLPGEVNWPMIVRSLIAEVRRLTDT